MLNTAIHGTACVTVVAIPKICGKRLVHLSSKGEFSWAIRDCIVEKMLRSGDSKLTLSQIHALITHSEPDPAYRSVGRKDEWARELEALSRKHFGGQYDGTTPPDSSAGKWKKL